MGREALIHGSWFGVGPGEGTVKRVIPDSHADFVFAVAGEEFGIVLCLLIMLIFAFIVMRGLMIALRENDDFTRYSVAGLVIVFGFQSIINMAVNLQLMPAKGMTLPFISLWRLVRDRDRDLDGHGAGADPKAAGKAHADRNEAGAAAGRARRIMAKGAILLAARRDRRTPCFRPRRWPTSWWRAAGRCTCATDDRAERFASRFPATAVHPIASATFGSRNPIVLRVRCGRSGAACARLRR